MADDALKSATIGAATVGESQADVEVHNTQAIDKALAGMATVAAAVPDAVAKAKAREAAEEAAKQVTISEADPSPVTYTVAPGDDIATVATSLGVSVGWLKHLNGMTSNRLKVGRVLKVTE